jgi:hypothetical protein
MKSETHTNNELEIKVKSIVDSYVSQMGLLVKQPESLNSFTDEKIDSDDGSLIEALDAFEL